MRIPGTHAGLRAMRILGDALRAAAHADPGDKAKTVYSAFADTDVDLAELVEAIGEVDV